MTVKQSTRLLCLPLVAVFTTALCAQQDAATYILRPGFVPIPVAAIATDEAAQTSPPQPGVPEHPVNKRAAAQGVPISKQQPKRILGIMPNYRAVSAGAIPPPPTLKQSFKVATQNSFDYSAFVFVGMTSAIAFAEGSHKQLGDGVAGFWGYSWRGFVDKTDGNYLVICALPTIFHQDERYYAMASGGIAKRAVYAATRILITPSYSGHSSFNASELLGRAAAQAISTTYYPSADRTPGELATKLGYSLLRDASTNVFREFWPDIATHVLHRHP